MKRGIWLALAVGILLAACATPPNAEEGGASIQAAAAPAAPAAPADARAPNEPSKPLPAASAETPVLAASQIGPPAPSPANDPLQDPVELSQPPRINLFPKSILVLGLPEASPPKGEEPMAAQEDASPAPTQEQEPVELSVSYPMSFAAPNRAALLEPSLPALPEAPKPGSPQVKPVPASKPAATPSLPQAAAQSAAQSAAPVKQASAQPPAAPRAAPASAAAPAKTELPQVPVLKPGDAVQSYAESPAPIPLKRVSATAGERVEISLPGASWTYLGEKAGKPGIRYESRRLSDGGVVFALLPIAAGEYHLIFQRQDLARGTSQDEFVILSVETAKNATLSTAGANQAASAPGIQALGGAAASASAPAAAAGASAPKPASASSVSPAAAPGVIQTPPPAAPGEASPPDTPEGLLGAARNAISAGKAQEALRALDRYAALYAPVSDEALLLYGKAYELPGAQKDIRKAHASYKRLRDGYPQSSFWEDAQARIAFIERFYLDIR